MVLTLDDNGIGLPADGDRIVEPYMTTREKGTGLGLAIVKKIVEEHFGDLAFEPNDTGGTCVTIRLDTDLLLASAVQSAASATPDVRRNGAERMPATVKHTGRQDSELSRTAQDEESN